MTREDKETLKVIFCFVAVIVLWVIGILAIITVVRAIDDGKPTARPGDWQKRR